jgi:hypothetical protein
MNAEINAGQKELADVFISAHWAELAGAADIAEIARNQVFLYTDGWGPREEREKIFAIATEMRAQDLLHRLKTTGSLWRKK